MSTHKSFDKICCVVLVLTLALTVLFINAEQFGVQKASTVMGYEKKLFDTSKVHTINIIMDDWDEFTANCKSEEYYSCTVVIDNEAYKNVAIRGKGNTSLRQVTNDRYSYKIEFDHYDSINTYYGLDKLCLNNIIQDNTYMKDYLTYRMMNEIGVASPLCSYAYITVNGEDWGLYLAIEGVEESFLQRNYGKDYGELYKPDSMDMGGGRGNGEKFDKNKFVGDSESNSKAKKDIQTQNDNNSNQNRHPQMPNGNDSNLDKGQAPRDNPNGSQNEMPDNIGGKGMQNGSDDVLLKYIDDNAESYSNIFENAKTDITEADKTRLINALKNLSDGEDLENTVDIESVVRYFVVHNFVLNFDSYTGSIIHNYYFYEKDGQMQMIPWDYNLAFGGFKSMGDATTLVNYPIDSPVSGGDVSDRPMLAWIFSNDEYTELYHKYFSEFITSYFDSGYFTKMIDSVEKMISPYVEKDSTKFCTYEEFENGVATLRELCLLRAESISGQLDGTIGSTSDTQNSESLIDADDLQISDMGSMNNTMGDNKNKENGNMSKQQPENQDSSSEGNSSDSFGGADKNFSNSETLPQAPQKDGQNTQKSDADGFADNKKKSQPNEQSSISASSYITVGASVFVLVLGLAFAVLFKRRKR